MNPIKDPIQTPTIIQVKSMILWSNKVTKTANSIPEEETRLPFLAVSGEPSIFKPKINSIEASM